MKTKINLHVEIECEDDSVDRFVVADFVCASVSKKFKKINGVIIYDSKGTYSSIKKPLIKQS